MPTSENSFADDESAFHARADRTLAAIFETVEEVLGAELDADLQGGILTIELDTGGQYVINKHAPNRQIWMSSPVSGAAHFAYQEGQGWVSTRTASRLDEVLAGELSATTGTAIAFEHA